MKLKDIHPIAYLAAVGQVQKQLLGGKSMEKLLDEARQEIPVIDSTLWVIARIYKMPDVTRNKRALILARRDLIVFLALREIEKGNVRPPETVSKPGAPAGVTKPRVRPL